MVGVSLAGLGRCGEVDGDATAAAAHYEDALAVGRRLGEPSVKASALEGLARLARRRGDHGETQRLQREATELRERSHRPAPPHERRDLAVILDA